MAPAPFPEQSYLHVAAPIKHSTEDSTGHHRLIEPLQQGAADVEQPDLSQWIWLWLFSIE